MVRADSPAALLAVIPHLLGFLPAASVVVIGLTPPRDRVRVTLRYDLPDPPEADLIADIAGHAAGVISSQQLTAAIAVGYGPEPLVTPVADAVRDAAQRAGIDLHDVLRVKDGRYWSYRCGDEACCPAAGVPFDPTAHPVAADMAAAGKQVLAGRAAVAARVAPIGGIAAESMYQATRRAGQHAARLLAKVRRSSRIGAVRHMIAAEGLATAGGMIARYRGGRFTSDYEIARITVALRDLRVRDDAWARMDPSHTDAHLRLWIDVVRRAQPGHVAAPAALLALAVWQSGHGAMQDRPTRKRGVHPQARPEIRAACGAAVPSPGGTVSADVSGPGARCIGQSSARRWISRSVPDPRELDAIYPLCAPTQLVRAAIGATPKGRYERLLAQAHRTADVAGNPRYRPMPVFGHPAAITASSSPTVIAARQSTSHPVKDADLSALSRSHHVPACPGTL